VTRREGERGGGEKPEGKKSPFLPFSESSIKTGFLKITPSKFVPTDLRI
jgi:hypothetical protein